MKKLRLVAASFLTLTLFLSGCSLKGEFAKEPLASYLSNDIHSLARVKRTPEIEALLQKYLSSFHQIFSDSEKSLEDFRKEQVMSMLQKLGLEKYNQADLQADFEQQFYFLIPKTGFLDFQKFMAISQQLEGKEPDLQSLQEITKIIQAVIAYELKSDTMFSKFYKDFVKSLGKKEDLKLTEEKFLDYTLYTLEGNIAEYALADEAIAKAQSKEEIMKSLNNILHRVSFLYTGDYVFIGFNPESIKAVLKTKEMDNSQLQTRLAKISESQALIYGYNNVQGQLGWYKDIMKTAISASPGAAVLGVGAKLEALTTTDLFKLPQYTITEGNLEDSRFLAHETFYKNQEVVDSHKELQKVPTAYASILPIDKVQNILFTLELNDVHGQSEYLKSLALSTGLIDEVSIQDFIRVATEQIPIFNVLKSDLKTGSDLSMKAFITYNGMRLEDQPVINFLVNVNDSEKTFKDIENAVSIYNKQLENEQTGLPTEQGGMPANPDPLAIAPYMKPEMKYEGLNENFALISLVVNDSLADFVKNQNPGTEISEGIVRPALYIGKLAEGNIIYGGLVGSSNLGAGQGREVFEKIFAEVQESFSANNVSFTNAVSLKVENVLKLVLALKGSSKEAILADLENAIRQGLGAQDEQSIEFALQMYAGIFEALLNVKEINVIHTVKDAVTSEGSFELTWGKEKVKRTPAVKKSQENNEPESNDEENVPEDKSETENNTDFLTD